MYKKKPVVPKHERTNTGVRFNVEQVDESGPLLKSKQSSPEYFLRNFYRKEKLLPAKIEASSLSRQPIVYDVHGLMEVALYAFDGHYPLILRSDDIWLTLMLGFSDHVEKNAEALRSNFVSFDGKKTLTVGVDHFVMGKMAPEDWERYVFPSFSQQIKENIGEKTHRVLASPYSTSTVTDIAAHEIALMTAMKSYFDYSMTTMCGIPWIELQGSEEDWKGLRQRAEQMCSLMVPEVGKKWFDVLGPVLDEFVNSYNGQVNHSFWQSMVKRVQHGQGSGSYTTISGWITLLYLKFAKYHKSWEQMESRDGPEPGKFPDVVCSAPVNWDYHGASFDLHFHAGIFGAIQDSESRALQCKIGWLVSHDPPKSKETRLIELNKLLQDLTECKNDDRNQQWRIKQVQEEIQKLTKD